jgi:hypothetical protein
MNDQNGDKTAGGETEAGARTNPVKASEATAAKASASEAPHALDEPEDELEPPEHEDDIEDSELEADPEPPEEAEAQVSETAPEQPPEKTKRRGGAVKVLAYLIALSLAGGGGYYLWNTYFAAPESAETDAAPSESSPAPEQKNEAERPLQAPETSAAPKASAENTASESEPAPAEPSPAVATQSAVAPSAAPGSTMTAETEKPAPAAEASQPAKDEAPVAAKPASESAASETKAAVEPATKAPGETAAAAAASSEPTPPAESAAAENKPAAESAPAASPREAAAPATAPEAAKPVEAAAPAPAPAPVEPTKPVAAPVETSPASAPAANPQTAEALAAVTAKLAAADATIETLSQRLQSVESQLGALKSEARAAPPPAPPDNSGEAAARLALAQSLLNAMRQGDDYSAQIAALQKLGADPEQLARLRAGLSAPSLGDLEQEFAALAPKLVESAAPIERTDAAKPPQSLKDAIWAQVETEARKLVRIRPAGSAEQDAAAATVAMIEKDLRAGDLAAALAERLQLPPPARSLSDRWAAGVQARIDAESAAKAELSAALRNLSKAKT